MQISGGTNTLCPRTHGGNMTLRRLFLLYTIAALFLSDAGLQTCFAQSASQRKESGAEAAKKTRAYRITNTDKLRISVFQEPELNVIARVDAKGCINLPLVQEVLVFGLTIAEAEKSVEAAYRDGRFLRNPQVTINVEEYAIREVSINGAVRSAGRYPYPAETIMTVLDLVTRAGGLTDVARGSAVKVTRLGPDGNISKVFEVDVESIIKGKSTKSEDTSLELQPGDVVFVPERII